MASLVGCELILRLSVIQTRRSDNLDWLAAAQADSHRLSRITLPDIFSAPAKHRAELEYSLVAGLIPPNLANLNY